MSHALQNLHLKFALHLFFIILNFSLALNTNANTILKQVKKVESELGARVGVSIYDIKTKKSWSYNGDDRFPLMSTFKTLACAKLLADSDAGNTSLATALEVNKNSLVTYTPVLEHYVGKKLP